MKKVCDVFRCFIESLNTTSKYTRVGFLYRLYVYTYWDLPGMLPDSHAWGLQFNAKMEMD